MKTKEFDFDTTKNVLPRDPIELRGRSRDSGRMVVLDRSTSTIEHTAFIHICDYFRAGDLLVLNDSYVLPDTLWFQCDQQRTQVTICGYEEDGTTIVEVVSKEVPVVPGVVLTSTEELRLSCSVIEPVPLRLWKVKFEPQQLLMPTLEQHGKRIHIDQSNWKKSPSAYRSVYASTPGSLEIPSAGLHFSQELLALAAAKGVEMAYITLHVGAAEIFTVRQIREFEIENHKVKSEFFKVGEQAAEQINEAMAKGRRIIAVGTTVMRTLETLGRKREPDSLIAAQDGWTDLYIYPGFDFKVVDVLLTNLHRPRSSHIVLTAAFAGKDLVMRSYREINQKNFYEFDMFGDSMLIV